MSCSSPFLFIIQTPPLIFFFFFNDTATTEIYTLSLHDALPISRSSSACRSFVSMPGSRWPSSSASCRSPSARSEEHTSELQSPCNLVCRLLLEKKNKSLDLDMITSLLCTFVHITSMCATPMVLG